MSRSLLVCRDRVEAGGGSVEDDEGKLRELETCMEVSVQEQLKTLPRLAEHIKSQITNQSRS